MPRSSLRDTLSTWSTGAPGTEAALLISKDTLRPTIASASASGDVCAVSTEPTTLPLRMMVTRSEIAIISFSLWVMRMMDLPSRIRLRMIFSRSSIS
ncbi:hypothetical protein D3C75_1118540 [compost metagenome]